MIRIIKKCFREVVGKAFLILAELETVIIAIKSMINSSAMTFMYNDPRELTPLTPAHFLEGKHLMSLLSVKYKKTY